MEKTVVFVRHTEAETRTDQNEEAKRALTEKGKADAKKIARSIKPILADAKLTLVSSPLIRAMETAAILAKKLDVEVVSADWVAEGSLDKLQEAIIACTSDVLIIVGHEPTLSQWIDNCCHVKLPMHKGTACAIRFMDDVTEGAELVWYLDKNAVPWNE
jgi:phosphohistidine phosphatase SixA